MLQITLQDRKSQQSCDLNAKLPCQTGQGRPDPIGQAQRAMIWIALTWLRPGPSVEVLRFSAAWMIAHVLPEQPLGGGVGSIFTPAY